jgi:hypothetical protein
VSNRDRSDRYKVPGRSDGDPANGANTNRPAPASGWEFDPAEIDRYLSGRSSRTGSSGRRPPSESSTAESLERLRRARTQQQRQQPRPTRPAQPAGTPDAAVDPQRAEQPPTRRTRGTATGQQPSGGTRPVTRPTDWETPPVRVSEPVDDAGWDKNPFGDDYLGDDDPTAAAPAASSRRQLVSRPSITLRRPDNLPRPAMPAFVQRADVANDPTALILIGLAVLSLAIMAILIGNRIDNVVNPFATHVNASGGLENVEKNTAVWRLPLLSVMFFLMNLVVAWFIAPTDRFLSRFLLGVSCVVQLVVWIALIRFLW